VCEEIKKGESFVSSALQKAVAWEGGGYLSKAGENIESQKISAAPVKQDIICIICTFYNANWAAANRRALISAQASRCGISPRVKLQAPATWRCCIAAPAERRIITPLSVISTPYLWHSVKT